MNNNKFLQGIRSMVLMSFLILAMQVAGQNKTDLKLFDACKVGDVKKAEKLIAKGANVNCVTTFHETPLMVSVSRNHNELSKLLLSKGSNPTYKSDCFFIEFKHQRKDGMYEVRVDKKQNGENALILAIENGNEEIFNLIMDQGIDINFEYEPSVEFQNYSNGLLYSLRNPLSGPPKMGSVSININGVLVTRSETDFDKLVCILSSDANMPMSLTPLMTAILTKPQNYSIIEKLAAKSSPTMNNLVPFRGLIDDPKTIEILKKYQFLR